MSEKHKCVFINKELLPEEMSRLYDKLKKFSKGFTSRDKHTVSLLDDYYKRVMLLYSFANESHINFEELLRPPLSMQGNDALLIKTNGKEVYFSPRFKRHFTLLEFTKLIPTPFTYTTTANLAIYYSKAKGLVPNKRASQMYGMNFSGDVIVLPQPLTPPT